MQVTNVSKSHNKVNYFSIYFWIKTWDQNTFNKRRLVLFSTNSFRLWNDDHYGELNLNTVTGRCNLCLFKSSDVYSQHCYEAF